jgi:hypothetical protein
MSSKTRRRRWRDLHRDRFRFVTRDLGRGILGVRILWHARAGAHLGRCFPTGGRTRDDSNTRSMPPPRLARTFLTFKPSLLVTARRGSHLSAALKNVDENGALLTPEQNGRSVSPSS